jgi:protein gp37
MGQGTKIQWCDDTVNCTSGCDCCELWIKGRGGPCYAGNLQTNRLSKTLPKLYSADFTEVRLIPGRMAKAAAWKDLAGTDRPDKPWLNGLPRVIFVGDLGDIMSKAVPFEFIRDEMMANITSKQGRRHIWMFLTKQPKRLVEFSQWYVGLGFLWPANVICGTSVTTQATVSRVGDLACVPGRLFVSAEPMWEAIGLSRHISSLDLVIAGGESRQSGHQVHPFDLAWARSLRDQCKAANVAMFLKQYGGRPYDSFYRSGVTDQAIHLKDSHGGDWDEWDPDMRIREFPRVAAVAH